MTLSLFGTSTARTRKPKLHRATLVLEDLEGRLVLNAAVVAPPANVTAHMAVRPKPAIDSLVQLTNFTINSINLVNGQLVASATATLNVLGQTVTQTLNNIPLTLTGTPPPAGSPAGTCDVLNLSLGPVHLDVLGLNVNLDNCAGGPVTVSITGNDSGVLGTLVCDLAGALNNGGLLSGLLGGLTSTQLNTLESGLTDILNGVIGQLLHPTAGGATAAASGGVTSDATPAGATDILNLHLNPIGLKLLGLNVNTSAICLDVYAVPGPGNLLGNLLGSLSNLLNNNGNNYNAINVLEQNILRVLNGLNL